MHLLRRLRIHKYTWIVLGAVQFSDLLKSAKCLKKRIDFDNLDASCVVESKFRIRNLASRHEENTCPPSTGVGGRPRTCIIFSSTFDNSTSSEQTHSLRAEKRTTATCRLQLTKTVTRNGNINVQISPPNTMIQANGGFSKEKTLTTEKEEVMEEELCWSLDTQVVIQPGHRTKADFVITEGNYTGIFQVDTVFEGKISVILRNKRKQPVTMLNIDDLRVFLRPEQGFKPLPNGNPVSVVFTNEGICTCSYGIEQHVELREEKI
uniref:Expressed conserved protein n=1 Tax=Echinococcus granulosus TaxID=6210 RepID=A0A068WUN8_ECHGR|nr:expressed conserved protein [Echinococcus granulosus]